MKSAWVDRDAQDAVAHFGKVGIAPDLALRIYTTRLLGRDPSLVLHGGGNTSVKTRLRDLNGDETDVLCVKGSGWDMAHDRAGRPARGAARGVAKCASRDALSDEDMVRAAARQPHRSVFAQPFGRNAAARFHAAQICRPYALDRRAWHRRPARRRAICGEVYDGRMGYRALHHAGLRPCAGSRRCVRRRTPRSRA